MPDEHPPGEGPRFQPEFSTGERLAHIEADSAALDRRFIETKDLFDQKLLGLSEKVDAKAEAQKEAVEKAEKSATQRFEAFVEQNDRKAEVTQQRLQALERGESAGHERRAAVNELKTSTLAVIGALATIALVILYVAHP